MMLDTLNILMVEDSPLDAELTLAALAGDVSFHATRVETEADFRHHLRSAPVDLILSDFSLPRFSGLLALKIARELRPDLPFIFVSGFLGEDTAVEMLKEGATDYVLKQRLIRLVPAVKRAVSEARERSERWLAEERLRIERQRVSDQQQALLASERRARTEAERASRMKDEFLATLSHELRTPLNAILGWSQILATGHCDPQELSEGLATIERNARAQTRIIEELLDMSRITSGKVHLELAELNLWPVVQASLESVKNAAAVKDLVLESPANPVVAMVRADPVRLQQVFTNLLTNAVKFTPRGGRVRVRLMALERQIQVSVSDTGEGISPGFLPFVFDRFRQADASITRRHGGLGLGLAIVKQLVELQGGSVHAASDGPGKGATFTITLPLVIREDPIDEDGTESRLAAMTATTGKCKAELRGVKVLVVDDEPDSLALTKRVLDDCRAQVFTAATATAAVELVKTQRPSVLVSDIGMPGEDGYAMISRIRTLPAEQGGNTPAVALTAYASAEDRARSINAGYQRHTSKPVEPAELIAIVADLAGLNT